MIPKLKPYFNKEELKKLFNYESESVIKFEQELARYFDSKFGLTFTTARAGLFAFLKSQNLSKAEILSPAYNCIAVPNAIVVSGNTPTFADVSTKDYNMLLNEVEKNISEKTRAIIPTHMYGYPMDIAPIRDSLREDIFIIQDTCLGVGTKVNGKYVANQGDIAMYSFGIGKQMSTLEGGMITTNNEEIYEKLKNFRDTIFTNPRISSKIFKKFYLPFSFLMTNKRLYTIIYLLWKNTKLLHRYTQNWSVNDIFLPKNYNEKFTDFQSEIGLLQLKKINDILKKREEIGKYYNKNLSGIKNITLPPIIKGATYSHYVPMVEDRKIFLQKMAHKGIHVGVNFDYSIPDTPAYKKYVKNSQGFRNSATCAEKVINLPNYPSLTRSEQDYIITATIESLS